MSISMQQMVLSPSVMVELRSDKESTQRFIAAYINLSEHYCNLMIVFLLIHHHDYPAYKYIIVAHLLVPV